MWVFARVTLLRIMLPIECNEQGQQRGAKKKSQKNHIDELRPACYIYVCLLHEMSTRFPILIHKINTEIKKRRCIHIENNNTQNSELAISIT